MKKAASLIVALVFCVGLFSMLSGCSLFGPVNLHPFNREERIATAKSEFRLLMERLNGYITFQDFSPQIDSDTTIQQVVDMVSDKGDFFLVHHIDTKRRFLDYCELSPIGLYIIKDDARWLELYSGS